MADFPYLNGIHALETNDTSGMWNGISCSNTATWSADSHAQYMRNVAYVMGKQWMTIPKDFWDPDLEVDIGL